MRITHEADYAIRVAYVLASSEDRQSAKKISEKTGITLRYSLKILRKLLEARIVHSFKGVTGGYMLSRDASQISLGEIIECIDGPIIINHCLSNEFDCSRVARKIDCNFHLVFDALSQKIKYELYNTTLDQFIES